MESIRKYQIYYNSLDEDEQRELIDSRSHGFNTNFYLRNPDQLLLAEIEAIEEKDLRFKTDWAEEMRNPTGSLKGYLGLDFSMRKWVNLKIDTKSSEL